MTALHPTGSRFRSFAFSALSCRFGFEKLCCLPFVVGVHELRSLSMRGWHPAISRFIILCLSIPLHGKVEITPRSASRKCYVTVWSIDNDRDRYVEPKTRWRERFCKFDDRRHGFLLIYAIHVCEGEESVTISDSRLIAHLTRFRPSL